MKTRTALTIISISAFLAGILGHVAMSAVDSVRPRIRGDWDVMVFVLIAGVLPIAIVILVWRKTRELRFTGILVAMGALLLSGLGSAVGFLAWVLMGGVYM